MKSKIFNIIWFVATMAVLAAWLCLMLHNGKKSMGATQNKEEELKAFYTTENVTAEAIGSQSEASGKNAEHIVTDGDVLSVGTLQVRVLDYQMLGSLSNIPNDTLMSMIEKNGGLDDRFMYGYFELELTNTGDNELPIFLKSMELGILDAKKEMVNFLESFYFEFSASDRCVDPDSTEIVLQPGETYRTGIVGLQSKEEMENTSYCLIYDPLGKDPFDMSDDDIFYLFLQ